MLLIMFLVLIGLIYTALLVTYLLECRDRKKSAQRLAPLKRKSKNITYLVYPTLAKKSNRGDKIG